MKRFSSTTIVIAAIGVGLLAPLPALANDAISTERLRYRLTGEDSQRGAFTSFVAVQRHTDVGIEVVRYVTYAKSGESHLQRGWGSAEKNVIKVTLSDNSSISGKLVAETKQPDTRFKVKVHADGRIQTKGKSSAGNSRAKGKLRTDTEGATDAEKPGDKDPSLGEKIKQKGKHLIALAEGAIKKRIRKERDKLVYDGVKLEQEFGISKYFHVGVGGKIHALKPEQLSPEQARTSKTKPRHIWIVSKVHGGARVPLSTSIPLGQVSIGLGFQAAARVDYTVTDIYELPKKITDVETAISGLKTVVKRTFDLPLDADEALAMTVGAVRVFDGQGSVAVSGNLSIGRDVANIKDVVRIGASARVGGFYRIQGDLRITVQRLMNDRARVRVRKGDTKSRGGSADLFLGASVDKGELKKELEPAVDYIDEALIDGTNLPKKIRDAIVDKAEDAAADTIEGKIKKVLRFRLYAGKTAADRDELDISHTYDLRNPKAVEAYKRAVRGDFTLAEKLSREPDAGVRREFRVVEAEQRTHAHASLELSVLLSATASKDIRFSDLHVEDETGTTDYEIFRFRRKRDIKVFKAQWKKDLNIEVIRRTRPDSKMPEDQVKRSMRITLDHLDRVTFKGEAEAFQRLMKSWGLDDASTKDKQKLRFLRSRYGKTRSRIEIAISETGIQKILASRDAVLFQGYVKAFATIEGKLPRWATKEGQTKIYDEANHGESTDMHAEAEWDEFERAQSFVKSMRGLAGAKTSQDRASVLKRLANAARYDLYTLAALINLAPRETVNIDASLQGQRIVVVDGRRGGDFAVPVVDPR